MKRFNLIAALSLAALLFGSCQKPENEEQTPPEVNPPVLTPLSQNDLIVPVEGGQAVIAYTLENPVEGGVISAKADESSSEWITGIDCQFAEEVRLTVEANEDPVEREGRVTVTYTYPDGELSFSTKVVQAGMETPAPDYYQITITENPNCTVTATTGGKEITEATKGTIIDLSATAAEGWTFTEYITEGITFQDPTSASQRFVMPENDVVIEAVVEDSQSVPHTVKVTGSGLGMVTAYAEGQTAPEMDNVIILEAMSGETITIKADPASPTLAFTEWAVKWGDVELEDANASTTTFTMPAEDVNIDAQFEEVIPDGCLVTVSNPRGGTITATDADGNSVDYVVEGTEVFLSIETKTNYTFQTWTLTGATPKDATSTQTSFIMPNNEVTVTAELTYEGGDIPDGETVVINGVTWATANVDIPGTFAASPTDMGLLFQFNRITGYSTEGNTAYDAGGETDFMWNATGDASNTWDSSNDPCPDGYRVPTADELRTLTDAANVDCLYDGVGATFTDKNTGAIMYLPGGVERNSSSGNLWNPAWCAYWSANGNESSSTLAYRLYVGETAVSVNQSVRACGYFVRCVVNNQ